MTDLPKHVQFHEEGPREGFQIEPKTYALAKRAGLVEALAESGLAITPASDLTDAAVKSVAFAARS